MPATVAFILGSIGLFAWDISQGASAADGSNSEVACRFSLFAPSLARDGEWFRVVTSAFSHADALHIGFNVWLLFELGRALENRFGSLSFATMYVVGILGGSVGAVALHPTAVTVGASGAVFALIGVLLVLQKMAGVKVFTDGIGPLVVLNVMISFRPGISLGGHLGGFAAGLIMGATLGMMRRRGARHEALAPIGFAGLGLTLAVVMIPVAQWAATKSDPFEMLCT